MRPSQTFSACFAGKAKSLLSNYMQLALLVNVRQGWKSLQGTNALAYSASSFAMQQKSFINLAITDNVKNVSFFITDATVK